MKALTAEQRTLRARAAAYAKHARTDGRTATTAAREGFLRRFLNEVDPDGVLPEPERHRRALLARKAYMSKLALKSSRARAKT